MQKQKNKKEAVVDFNEAVFVDNVKRIDFGKNNTVTNCVFMFRKVVAINGVELGSFYKRIKWLFFGSIEKNEK